MVYWRGSSRRCQGVLRKYINLELGLDVERYDTCKNLERIILVSGSTFVSGPTLVCLTCTQVFAKHC